ncbi:MAG: phosphate signaling complex protein PhoU [Verrucomicrobia bacterium]|nr:phosphate signaling complex protein PhoU [Verrucomicrobiota bacterium]
MIHFEQELDTLKARLLNMALAAESAVTRALKALVERDDTLAARIKEEDKVLDRFEMDIDEMAIDLLTKAPLASHLRLITVAMKAALNLERIGDEATTIGRRAIELNAEPQLKPFVDIPRMATLALAMLRDAMQSFVDRDPVRARSVIPRDVEVDGLNKQVHRELVSFMIEKPSTITRCLHLMVVSKSLERIADHATNIAEEIVYYCEAKDIRHDPEIKRPHAPPGRPAPNSDKPGSTRGNRSR